MLDNPESPNTQGHGDPLKIRVQMLKQRAQQAGLALRALPPLPTSCCGRGCNGCVWESYFNALDDWCEEVAQATLSIKHQTVSVFAAEEGSSPLPITTKS